MALLNLGLVTECFTTLLQRRIPEYPVWPGTATLAVSAGPPDAVNGAHALSFYLYHVREDAHTKSLDPALFQGNEERNTPMGLSLYYVLTPRSNTADANTRAMADQLMMGLALKTLRDVSLIDDTTTVQTGGGPVIVMPLAMRGRGNRLRCTLVSTPPSEAGEYWQAGSNPMRLSAYFEVSATLLEPDEPMTRAGRVLHYGIHTFLRGNPWIDRTENIVSFTPPGETLARELLASPASVPFGGTLKVAGADLFGDAVALFLSHPDFTDPVEADASWTITSDGSELLATVQPSANGITIAPGIYGALVRTTTRKTLPDGSQRDFQAWSNESSFAVAPTILSVTGAAERTVSVDRFEPHLLGDDELQVYLGADRLTRVTTTPPGPGEFITPNAPAAARTTLRFAYPAGTASGTILPLRLIVRGAESGPWWDVAP